MAKWKTYPKVQFCPYSIHVLECVYMYNYVCSVCVCVCVCVYLCVFYFHT